jgi:hypothetical protein
MSEKEDVVATEYDRLRGRLAGLIESFGLPERQERAVISTLKSLTYDSQKVVLELVEEDE